MMNMSQFQTEYERQNEYLERLPEDYTFPLFNSAVAIESQRKSGYRHTAAAAREIVDNAIEASADTIHVIFDHVERVDTGKRGKKGRKRQVVSAVAFIDNGSGMKPGLARYALAWGGGTHYDKPTSLGRFGFGLPNASINQTRSTQVFTRTEGEQSWRKAELDIDNVNGNGSTCIGEEVQSDLPGFVQDYLVRNSIDLKRGTVVVWMTPDRLTYRRTATLKEHFLDDFGVVYRYLLNDGLKIIVDGQPVEPTDPLFLMPKGRLYRPVGGDDAPRIVWENTFVLKVYTDSDTGERLLKNVEKPNEIDADDPDLQFGRVQVRVVRFPPGFALGRKGEAQIEPIDDYAQDRLAIRESRRGVSFVRANREIETKDVFPRSRRAKSTGLGDWPLLQGYAYHWACEIRFDPDLDEIFGITNDKQRVEPHENLWKILASDDLDPRPLDRQLQLEQNWQKQERKSRRDEIRLASARKADKSDIPTPAEQAAVTADIVTGVSTEAPPARQAEVKEKTEEAIRRKNKEAKANGKSELTSQDKEKYLKTLENEKKRKPYSIEYADRSPDEPFYSPEFGPVEKVVVRINRGHPFYKLFYQGLRELSVPDGGVSPKDAVDYLLIALSKGELGTHVDECRFWYEEQRKGVWSKELERGYKILEKMESAAEPEVEEEIADFNNEASG